MTGQGRSHGSQVDPLGSKAQPIKIEFSPQWAFTTDINIPPPPQLKVLGWRGYMWSMAVRPVGRTTKFSKTTLEAAFGREVNIQFSGNSSG